MTLIAGPLDAVLVDTLIGGTGDDTFYLYYDSPVGTTMSLLPAARRYLICGAGPCPFPIHRTNVRESPAAYWGFRLVIFRSGLVPQMSVVAGPGAWFWGSCSCYS